ncbi:DUF6194 family protein [Streptomyces sp. NPDC006296]|uniref:DUF6194 family protein n=1 Tax=Streptomyces sp. NPDC006296 TaxID=3156746 RepID=UPI0033A7CBCE
MTIDEIIDFMRGLDGVLIVAPTDGDGSPEISWGDTFFFHSPDGTAPGATTQPFATIVTKDYPGDESSLLDRSDTFRVNIAAGKHMFREWTGREPGEPADGARPALADAGAGAGAGTGAATETAERGATDTVIAHPVYGAAAWLAVVNPGPRTDTAVRLLLREAHRLARARHERRAGAVALSRTAAQGSSRTAGP